MDLKISYIGALKKWREDDQADKITLSRHEVVMLLDEIENIHEYCI